MFKSGDPLVVILDEAGCSTGPLGQVAAAPVSRSIRMAAEFDLIIAGDANPLGFDFMVEVWNETPVLKQHLRQFIGNLPDEAISALRGLYTVQLLGEENSPELAEWVGLRIMGENDPRLVFQEMETEAVAYLARAATGALALEKVVQEPARKHATLLEPRRIFVTPLRVGRLSGFVTGMGVAYAAGSTGEEETYVVTQAGDEYFTFELLVSRLPPYEIYLVVRQVSPELEARECIVIVPTADRELRSMPTELRVGAEIRVGKDPNFNPRSGQPIQVEIA